ncbi:MAG: inner rane transporter RhtA [Microbacteriaceae bacterium]|nr:inner rane transporter RhtA [Microbacteriaceae bacterium]
MPAVAALSREARTGRRLRVAGVVVSASSVQVGAAFGATLFPFVGPFGVAAMRQVVSAVALLAISRPPLRRIGLRRLSPALALGLVLVGMNLALYSAVQRIGLGLAVTVEFAGPLAVSLAASRRWRDAGSGLLAVGGIALLTGAFGGRPADPVGLLLGLAAAALWACYILLSQRAGALPGVTGTAVASLVGTVLTLPLLVVILVGLPSVERPRVLAIGVVTGVLSSAFPYSLDLVILRTLPRALFGMLQSLHPVAAAVFGLLVLGQGLDGVQLAAVAAVCLANILAVAGHRTVD